MKSNTYLYLQLLAGVITAQIPFLATDPVRNVVGLLMSTAIIALTTAAILTGRRSAAREARAEAPAESDRFYMATTSLRGCYEIVLQVKGDGNHEDMGDDTHLLHGENFNALIKRVDGVITGGMDDGRTVQIHLKTGRQETGAKGGGRGAQLTSRGRPKVGVA